VVKIFLSASGRRSHEVARLLHEWLPIVHYQAEPFMADVDIDAGVRWQQVIARELSSTSFGIICVTAANRAAPWLCFEAGALSHSIDAARVVPLAIDLDVSGIDLPLAQFQARPLTQFGVTEVVAAIDEASRRPLGRNLVENEVVKWWPDLEEELRSILDVGQTRSEQMDQIFNTVRAASDAGDGIRYASAALSRFRRNASIQEPRHRAQQLNEAASVQHTARGH
jgi:hypothetical protein